ncbi:alcohol oxidase [Sistotremastrum niveocremeum HHB9708]|uniref:Alcohol oxidase n=1 Tax=Sistotremastrum niveocremeum HHB9708 TaxID=1314777 RepID=A0A164TBS2_9AGAM|nr:alcohol oxidase [Sistotremastrum niveocremeum HHB9708]
MWTSLLVALCALSSTSIATPIGEKRALPVSGISTDPTTADGQTFDYIVVGGGLAGFTVAARLAENSSATILLIEAGGDDRTNPNVFDIYNYGAAFGSYLDWNWQADQGRAIHGGKTLGGSTSINGAAWTRATADQYNALSSLLPASQSSLNWNFNSLLTYMQKAETFSAPNSQQQAKGANSVAAYHGTTGPVQATFPDLMFGGPQQMAFVNTITNLTGITHSPDINGGAPNAVSFTPDSIDWHRDDHRSSSVEAYFSPVEGRRHSWLILTKFIVNKVLFSGTTLPLTANAVTFQATNSSSSSKVYTAHARNQVVLAAGSISSPAILQRSGVGDPALLNPLGIKVVNPLVSVGLNLQEQTIDSLGAHGNSKFNAGGSGPSDCIAFPNIDQVFGSASTGIKNGIRANLSSWATSQAPGNALSASALLQIYQVQADLIVNKSAPIVELFYDTGFPDDLGIDMWQLLPFSRGSVKITSTSAFTQPKVAVNYFSVDYDLQVQVAGAQLSRAIFAAPPLNGLTTGETIPGFSQVPNSAAFPRGNPADWRKWIKNGFASVAHPIATCAMMDRALGGVVDGTLRVYDTTNLRVVDASILPLQISAHLSSTLYGVAEKAADIIKSGV